MRSRALAIASLLFAAPALAQRTLVTGTVDDASGIPYSGASLQVTLSLPLGVSGATLNGAQIAGSAQRVTLDNSGSFLMQLPDNNVVQPSGTQWTFAITMPGVSPPMGTGPQICSSTLTITGVSQAVSIICPAIGAGGVLGAVSKTLFVDVNRTDTYTQTGSNLRPFKSIMAAVNQVIANGDNATFPYLIDIAPGSYPELIVLESLSLFNLTFDGHSAAHLTNATPFGIRSQTNNSNLVNTATGQPAIVFKGLYIDGGGNSEVLITFPAGNNSWEVRTCEWSVTTFTISQVSGANQLNVYDSTMSPSTATISAGAQFNIFHTSHSAGGTITLTGGSFYQIARGSRNSGSNYTGDATSTLTLCCGGRMDGSVTTSGPLQNRAALITGAITINSGGTYTEISGAHSGTLTVNAGGSYTTSGSLGIVVAAGTVAMPTAAIAGGACSAAATGTVTTGLASALLTTDTIAQNISGGLPGINPGQLVTWATIASNGSAPTFEYCNETGASVTPPATTLNWKVVR